MSFPDVASPPCSRSRASYDRGCRCRECKRAKADYNREWRAKRSRQVPITVTHRELAAHLVEQAGSFLAAERMFGLDDSTLHDIVTGVRRTMHRESAARFAAVFPPTPERPRSKSMSSSPLPEETDASWMRDGQCVKEGVPTAEFFVAVPGWAMAVCARCGVRDECLAYAIHHRLDGVWGGTGPKHPLRAHGTNAR